MAQPSLTPALVLMAVRELADFNGSPEVPIAQLQRHVHCVAWSRPALMGACRALGCALRVGSRSVMLVDGATP